MTTLREALDKAHALVEAKRPISAVRLMESVERQMPGDANKAFVLYNIGCTYRSGIGDGISARERLLSSVTLCAQAPANPAIRQQLWPNACENLMLLSLSFEEYRKWAEELRRLRPDADILRGQVPTIEEVRERGVPWYEALEQIALGYYSRNDARNDPGLYGEAAATFHLILTHRKSFRVPREDWKRAAYEFAVLRFRLGADTAVKAERQNPMVDPSEAIPIVADALPLLDEYLTANPQDSETAKLKEQASKWIAGLSRASESAASHGSAGMSSMANAVGGRASIRLRCPACGNTIDGPSVACPNCGHRFARPGRALVVALIAGAALAWAVGAAWPSAPAVVSILAALLGGTLAFMVTMGGQLAKLAASPPSATSPAIQRQERIEELTGMKRPSEVRCRNGHRMRPFEDEGVLLAACPECGIVRPHPGTMARTSDVMRVAAKYEQFEL
jgi:hypothetical protein